MVALKLIIVYSLPYVLNAIKYHIYSRIVEEVSESWQSNSQCYIASAMACIA